MSGNGDYGAVREEVFAEARERARKLASEGLLAREIERRLDARLTATERELFRGIVRQEVAAAHSPPRRARRESITDLQPSAPHAGGLARPAPGERWKEAMRRAWRHLDHTRRRGVLAVAPVALAAMVVAVLLGSVLTTGGHRRGATPADTGAVAKARSVPTSSAQTRAPANGTRRPVTPAHKREPPAGPATVGKRNVPRGRQGPHPGVASSALLNDHGFQLMNAGRYAQAIPLLRRAVSAPPHRSSGLTYAYALFNLGRSLRLAGRPQEAIPLLERRLLINDQRETVARELQAARRSLRSALQFK